MNYKFKNRADYSGSSEEDEESVRSDPPLL